MSHPVHKPAEDKRFEYSHTIEDRIVRDHCGCAGVRGGCRLQRVRSSQVMNGTESRGQIGDLEVRRDPV